MHRPYTPWTDLEKANARDAVLADRRYREIAHLFPDRNEQAVRNMLAYARRTLEGTCPDCGGFMPDDATYAYRACPKCRNKVKRGRDTARKRGVCAKCRRRPADGSLTLCVACSKDTKARYGRPLSETPPASDRSWTGLLRWLSSGGMNTLAEHLPLRGKTVVDLFGGSAAFTLGAIEHGAAKAVYVDVHPDLCRLVEAVKRGRTEEVVAESKALSVLTPEELLARYKGGEGAAVARAALVATVAGSVAHRDMHQMVIPKGVVPLTEAYARRMRRATPLLARAEVFNGDFAEAIRRFDGPDTVFFVDPPYLNTAKYEHNLTIERFRELNSMLADARGEAFLITSSTRAAAAECLRFPHAGWRRWMHTRQLVVSTFPIPAYEPVNFQDFGLTPEPRRRPKVVTVKKKPPKKKPIATMAEVMALPAGIEVRLADLTRWIHYKAVKAGLIEHTGTTGVWVRTGPKPTKPRRSTPNTGTRARRSA